MLSSQNRNAFWFKIYSILIPYSYLYKGHFLIRLTISANHQLPFKKSIDEKQIMIFPKMNFIQRHHSLKIKTIKC